MLVKQMDIEAINHTDNPDILRRVSILYCKNF